MPRSQSSISSRYSRQITQNSIATPTATKTVNHDSHRSQETDELSKALISLSRADMALSKAEASVSKLEAVWIKAAKITIVGLLGAIVYGLWIIILALREEYIYKKSLKQQ